MKYFRKKKLGAIAVAGITSVALLATGTFAWQAISQPVTNEIERKINPGARLHDDFNGENKDIYVENFTDPSDGVSVYARIQLREYMEIGTNAGKTGAAAQADKNVEVVGKKDADINDPNTWHIHKNEVNTIEAMEFHDYWSWTMGNEDTSIDKYYMPTFNKDNESLTADVNGTIEGLDGNRHEGDPYDDYVDWKSTSTQSQKEVLNGGLQTDNDVEHTAKKLNYHAKIISMKQWKQLPSDQKIGPYWVYDNDGWAYWAQEIAPGETTGLLLNGVQMEKVPENNYYYGIHAAGQFATAGDWTGFDGDITQDGKTLLNTISHRLPKVIYMTPKNGSHQFVVPGSSLKLEVDVKVQNATGDPSEKEVEWSIHDESLANTIKGNTFRPTAAMADQTYVLTATSKLTPSVTTSIDVTVLPLGVSIVEGADQKQYVYFGNNVYKRIEEEGRLSNFICAGEDKIIGNDNDINDVYDILSELDTVSAVYYTHIRAHET
ncbi:MAG: hypothetical protein K2L08_00570 [Erysipelotrichaceae bacterium]|nr:hypothetical protein [Erysipelotrichaceae bacterium]